MTQSDPKKPELGKKQFRKLIAPSACRGSFQNIFSSQMKQEEHTKKMKKKILL